MVYLQHVMDRVWVLRIFVKNFTVSGEQALDVQKSQMEKRLKNSLMYTSSLHLWCFKTSIPDRKTNGQRLFYVELRIAFATEKG